MSNISQIPSLVAFALSMAGLGILTIRYDRAYFPKKNLPDGPGLNRWVLTATQGQTWEKSDWRKLVAKGVQIEYELTRDNSLAIFVRTSLSIDELESLTNKPFSYREYNL